jgi:hypothetical protein
MPGRVCAGPIPGTPCPTRAIVQAPRGSKQAPRCPACQRGHQQAHNARRPGQRTHAEQARRRQAIAAHVEVYGYLCPGCPPSDWKPHAADPQTNPLTAHHVEAVGAGGSEHGSLQIMCRRGNSSIGDRTDRSGQQDQGGHGGRVGHGPLMTPRQAWSFS